MITVGLVYKKKRNQKKLAQTLGVRVDKRAHRKAVVPQLGHIFTQLDWNVQMLCEKQNEAI